MKPLNHLAIILCFLISSTTYSQEINHNTVNNIASETSIVKLLKINNDYLINEMYKKSLASGKRLVELDPENANFNFRYGLALNQTTSDLDESFIYLENASKNTAPKIDMFNSKEKRAPIDAIFYYAISLHRYGQIDDAINLYNDFILKAGEKHTYYQHAQLSLIQAKNAKKIGYNEEVKSLDPLGETINSKSAEFAPIISFDGSTLYFTSNRYWKEKNKENTIDKSTGDYYEDVYSSYYEDGQWKAPSRLDFCSPTENEASVSISIDERRVYLYSSSTGNGDIYYTDYKNGKFNDIILLENKEVNTNEWQPHYFVSADNKFAFFSTENGKDSYGGLDIYMMKKEKDGTWSSPVNLGPEINTRFDEDAPFLTFDGKYLYFSSNGERSIGGYDIFRAEWIDGKFVNVENLGLPINSTYDDLYYTVTTDGMNALISSFRKGGSGNMDIYQIIYNESNSIASVLKGRVYMTDGSALIPENVEIRLKCLNCEDAEITSLLPRIRDGRFLANLKKCKEYEIQYINSITKAEIAIQKLNTTCDEMYEEIEKELGIEVEGDKIVANKTYAFRGTVFDKETNKGLGNVSIEIQDEKGKSVFTMTSQEDGNFTTDELKNVKFNTDYTYKIIVKKEDYITISKEFTFKTEYEHYIDIDPIGIEKSAIGKDLGNVIVLNTIYYDLNSSYLRKDAKVELNKIVESMNLNPNIVIELRSHTDCRESEEYNQWLSDRRAVRAADYIKRRIKNGGSRVSGKGYGESELLNNCGCDVVDTSGCSEDQHQLNRRTEFIIIKK